MKFELNAKEFKNAVDRAMSVMAKKPSLELLNLIKIKSADESIIITAITSETFVDIVVPAHIIEAGETYIEKTNLTKVYNLSDYITVESNNGIFSVKNQKKCCEVMSAKVSDENYPKSPCIDENVYCLFEESERNLINTFVNMDCFRGKDGVIKPILDGFNINGLEKQITACDGYRLVVKELDGKIHKSDFNITIPGDVCVNLKKIGNTKRDDNICVFYGKPSGCKAYFVFFKGVDFTYSCRVLEGEYMDVSKILNVNKTYSFKFSPKQLENIAKEYSKERNVPMHIIKNEDKIYTTIVSGLYKTADILESVENMENMSNEYCYCVNPSFIKDAMSLFTEDKIVAYGENRMSQSGNNIISPIVFKNEEYTALVLPMTASKELIEHSRKLISKL